MTAAARALLVAATALVGAACGANDPCAGLAGTCLAVEVTGPVPSLDTVRVEVTGAFAADHGFTLPSAHALPVLFAIRLPDGGAHLDLRAVALLGGHTVGTGALAADVAAGAHRSVGLVIAARGPACDDGFRDGDESDVDCGGPDCAACPPGRRCGGDRDCTERVCAPGGRCAAPTCSDGRKNGGESDVDCGGPCTTPCGEGGGCALDSDCASRVCAASHRCAKPTCGDGVKNGGESDVDCGGPDCAPCGDGARCKAPGDCASHVCGGGDAPTCQKPTCMDHVKNGGETDVDCGGPVCPRCDAPSACGAPADCKSDVCTGGKCQAPTCSDGKKNGGETDVDCGGPCPKKCDVGQGCAGGGDCAEKVCSKGACQAPGCGDGVKNGDETDVDCGGKVCGACKDGQACLVGADCKSLSCPKGACVASSCSDGVKNGQETDVDCGGPSCKPCRPGRACKLESDCNGGACLATRCALAFTAGKPLSTGGHPQQISAADLDHDQRLDLVFADSIDGDVSVCLGAGDGTFGIRSTFPVGKEPIYFALADVVGAGHLDLLVPSYYDDDVFLLVNQGNGTFVKAGTLPVAKHPIGIVAGDFDGDGRTDFATASESGGYNVVLAKGGSMFAILGADAKTPLWAMTAGDFSGTGVLDLVLLTAAGTGGLFVPGNGQGGFGAPLPLAVPGFAGVVAGDLDKDKRQDLVVADTGKGPNGWRSAFDVLLSKGKSTFAPAVPYAVASGPALLALGDLDGDGVLDVAVPNSAAATVSVLRGRGDGTFEGRVDFAAGSGPTAVAVGDFNGDGRSDLAVTNYGSNDVTILLNALK